VLERTGQRLGQQDLEALHRVVPEADRQGEGRQQRVEPLAEASGRDLEEERDLLQRDRARAPVALLQEGHGRERYGHDADVGFRATDLAASLHGFPGRRLASAGSVQ
jgi:hypothetical protein